MKKKNVILSSILSLVLCLSLIVGGTFALFTSESKTNIAITSGKVEVVATIDDLSVYSPEEIDPVDFSYDETKNGAINETTFKNGGTATLNENALDIVNMTPGDRVNFNINLANNSNVAIKYQMIVTYESDSGLGDLLTYEIDGKNYIGDSVNGVKSAWTELYAQQAIGDPIAVEITLPADVTAQELSTKILINVVAVQGNTKTDGETEVPTEIYINNAEELIAFANLVNSGSDFADTVIITNDIDLTGYEWTPLNLWAPENSNILTIDGTNHTISNMTVAGGSKVGFIGSNARDITIQNLAFDTANVTTSGSMAGVVIGYQYGDVVLNNVDVTNSTVMSTAEKGIRIGGLVGQSFLQDGATLTINNCDLDNIEVSGYHNVAGMVGSLMNYSTLTDKWEIKNNSITNSVFTITSDSMSNESYISAFACEGGNYGDGNKYTWVDVNTFARADYQGPNAADNNTYNVPEQLDPNAIYINTVDDLKNFRDQVNAGDNFLNKNVYLAADLDLANEEWTPIGTSENPFMGNFSGRGYTISNLKITSGENVGLFGHITLSPSNYKPGIRNLTLNNVTITANNSGAFVGNANTTTNNAGNGGALQLIDLKLTGDVKIEGANVGGVMGTEWTNFQIGASNIIVAVNEGSYVKGTGRVGGVFASTPHGTVSDITSNIDVYASGETVVAGGIVGCAGWTLTDVTCTGDVIVTGVTATESGKYQVGKIVGCEANNNYWSLYNAPVEGNANRGLGSEFENFTATGAISITLGDSTVLTSNGLTAEDHRGTDNLIDYTEDLVGAPIWAWAW